MDGLTEVMQQLLPEGWELEDDSFGLDSMLVCPHGATIEQDGECPDGCISPLRTMGLL
jgi:hypothetical protein